MKTRFSTIRIIDRTGDLGCYRIWSTRHPYSTTRFLGSVCGGELSIKAGAPITPARGRDIVTFLKQLNEEQVV
jgi:hypothetical protein